MHDGHRTPHNPSRLRSGTRAHPHAHHRACHRCCHRYWRLPEGGDHGPVAGRPSLVLAVWVAAGLLSLAGTFTYSELAAMMPHAGGEYVYLRTAYGRATAFCYGWMRFVVGTGGLSALAVGF